MAPYRLFIGLGSNLSEPLEQLRAAWHNIEQHPLFQRSEASPIYRSLPVGPGPQDDYLNAVVSTYSCAEPLAILDALQTIEQRQGRQRTLRWGPRTLDLDLLLADEMKLNHPRLCLPHPRLQERNFALIPLLDLAPDARLPDGTCLNRLPAARSWDGLSSTSLTWKH